MIMELRSLLQLKRAFSLVEVLGVMTVIAIIGLVSMAGVNQISRATALTTNSTRLIDQLNLARQTALSANRSVEVRFYQLTEPGSGTTRLWRGVQSFLIESSGARALDRPVYFTSRIQVAENSTLSNIFESRTDVTVGNGASAKVELPGVKLDYNYISFRFKPDGSTTLASPLYLTLHSANTPTSVTVPPRNFFTIQIDPITGRTQTFRP